MGPEKDGWYLLTLVVAVIAILAWAFSLATGIGGAWLQWTAVAVSVLMGGIVAVRAWLNARGVVWTEEEKEAQRRRIKRELWQSSPALLVLAGVAVLTKLVADATLPQWAGAVLILVLFAGWILLWEYIRRRIA